MGYDFTRLVFPVEVDAEMSCSICHGVLEDPQMTECGHVFCSKCITQWLCSKQTCPMDRNSVTIADLKPVEKNIKDKLSGLEIRCENDGCSVTLPLFNITKHAKEECEYKPNHLLLSAGIGITPEHPVDIFGLYISAGNYYKQLHDVNTTFKPSYKIYKLDGKGNWVVGDGKKIYLRNSEEGTETVPESGWIIMDDEYDDGTNSIRVVKVENISQALCGNINLAASGAARIKSHRMGKFQPTGLFSAGRQVFVNQRTGIYLFVCPDYYSDWTVGPVVDNDDDEVDVCLGPITLYRGLCPAMCRTTAVNTGYSGGWWYWDDDGECWRDGIIKAECSVHSH